MGTLTTLGHALGSGTRDVVGRAPAERADVVRHPAARPVSAQDASGWSDLARSGSVYLFIYRVRHRYDAYAWVDNIRYCTVLSLGNCFADAERIAINCVHQHGWRILKTDTATEFALDRFTDGGADRGHIANLRDFGVSFRLNR